MTTSLEPKLHLHRHRPGRRLVSVIQHPSAVRGIEPTLFRFLLEPAPTRNCTGEE